MKKQILIIFFLFIMAVVLSGCSEKYELSFSEITTEDLEVPLLERESIGEIIKEIETDKFQVILYKMDTEEFIRGGLKFNNQIYDIGDISMGQTFDENLFSIDNTQALGKNMLKLQGILGANYAHSNYIYLKGDKQLFRLHVDGNTQEIDIDNDGVKEIISTMGTVPETKIYCSEKGKFMTANINKSIDAKAVYLADEDKKLFEVYFEPNKSKLFYIKDNSLNMY